MTKIEEFPHHDFVPIIVSKRFPTKKSAQHSHSPSFLRNPSPQKRGKRNSRQNSHRTSRHRPQKINSHPSIKPLKPLGPQNRPTSAPNPLLRAPCPSILQSRIRVKSKRQSRSGDGVPLNPRRNDGRFGSGRGDMILLELEARSNHFVRVRDDASYHFRGRRTKEDSTRRDVFSVLWSCMNSINKSAASQLSLSRGRKEGRKGEDRLTVVNFELLVQRELKRNMAHANQTR